MIKEFFFPEHIQKYYVFKKRIIALHATQTAWHAVGIELYKKEKTIFYTDIQTIEHAEKKRESLELLKKRLPYYDAILTDAPYHYLIFKEILFPFDDRDKIEAILPIELAQIVPLSLENTQKAFTMFASHNKEHIALTCLIQNKHIEESALFFDKSGLTITHFVPIITSVYGLFKNHIDQKKSHILLIVDQEILYSAAIKNGVLKKIRTISLESNNQVSEKTAITLSSLLEEGPIATCYYTGTLPEGLKLYLQENNISLHELSLKNTDLTISFKEKNALSLIAAACAYPSNVQQDVFFISNTIKQKEEKGIINNVILASVLLLSSISIFSFVTFAQIKKLQSQILQKNAQLTKNINTGFKNIKKKTSLRESIKSAQKEVEKEEKVWLPFLQQTQQSFLEQLLILSTHIDSQVLGLEIKRMVLTKDTMSIEGHVRNFEAIEEFEKELKATKLFKRVPDLQETHFSLVLPFAQLGETA